MGLKLSQNINFWLVFRFLSVSGRDKTFLSRQSFLVATLVATYCLSRHWSRHTSCRDIGRDTIPVATYFLTAACFSSPTCRGHNFFILTRIWACEYSLESSWNLQFSHGDFELFDVPNGTEKSIFPVARCDTLCLTQYCS